MPIVRLNHSDFANSKWVFNPRQVQQPQTEEETSETQDTGNEAEELQESESVLYATE